ncbi:MAG TPA: alpha/beta fold hydrolase [Candidatus Binatia bacterium]|nr:alpha/beta fold hydrolase [Candidatus Binatia bacterium]
MRVGDTLSKVTGGVPAPRDVVRAARDAAAWFEERLPWPLDLGPALWRWSLDAVLGGGNGAAEPEARPRDSGRRAAGTGMRSHLDRSDPEHRSTSGGAERARTGGAARVASERAAHAPDRSQEARASAARPGPAAPPTSRRAPSGAPAPPPRVDIATAGSHAREATARGPLYTRDGGQGPAIVLLHAFPLNGRMWEPQLEALRDRYRIVAPDLPGFGLSWTDEDSTTIASYAEQVHLALDHLGVREMVLVGASMGGYVAFELVPRLGDRIRGLVLADTRATPDDEAGATARHELAAEIEANGLEVLFDALVPRLLGPTTLALQPELGERVRALILENKVPGAMAALRAMASRRDATPLLEKIACPVMCIVGDEDQVTPPEAALAMASRLRDASVEVVARVGHLPSLEAPEEFDRLLSSFAARVFGA